MRAVPPYRASRRPRHRTLAALAVFAAAWGLIACNGTVGGHHDTGAGGSGTVTGTGGSGATGATAGTGASTPIPTRRISPK